jgi:hypothetical protein
MTYSCAKEAEKIYINLVKCAQDLCAKNYKVLIKKNQRRSK